MASLVWKPAHTLVAVLVGAVLVAGGVTAGVLLTNDRSPTVPTPDGSTAAPAPTATPSSTPTPSAPEKPIALDPLTGGKVSHNAVIAVKIENTYPARPQVGLAAADIIVVEEVEGGLTRLIAVYHSAFPRRVGPVRSARNTDLEFLPLFGRPGLVYSGANSSVQANIERSSIVALPRSTRDPSRVAPHNVIVDLASIEGRRKLRSATAIGWTFADSGDWAGATKKHAISTSVGGDAYRFTYSGGVYTVRWNGRRYSDGGSGKVAKTDVTGASSVKSETVGRGGKVTIYSHGKLRSGTWVRTKVSGPMRFLDAEGQDISLAKGKTWLLLRG